MIGRTLIATLAAQIAALGLLRVGASPLIAVLAFMFCGSVAIIFLALLPLFRGRAQNPSINGKGHKT